jgi:hypothetical protein
MLTLRLLLEKNGTLNYEPDGIEFEVILIMERNKHLTKPV